MHKVTSHKREVTFLFILPIDKFQIMCYNGGPATCVLGRISIIHPASQFVNWQSAQTLARKISRFCVFCHLAICVESAIIISVRRGRPRNPRAADLEKVEEVNLIRSNHCEVKFLAHNRKRFPKPLDRLHKVWYISITKGEGTAKPKRCDPRESVRPIPHDPTARSLRCAVYKCEPIPRVCQGLGGVKPSQF